MREQETIEIIICMGSSCFARGNQKHLDIIEQFIKTHKLVEKVELVGSGCEKNCSHGPVIKINGTTYTNLDSASLIDILNKQLKVDEER